MQGQHYLLNTGFTVHERWAERIDQVLDNLAGALNIVALN
jgi:hypothetical protein